MDDLDGTMMSPFPRPIDASVNNNKMKGQLSNKWRTIKFCSILLTRNIKSRDRLVVVELSGEAKKATLDIYPRHRSKAWMLFELCLRVIYLFSYLFSSHGVVRN